MWQETLLTILALQFVNHTDSFLVPYVLYTLGCLAVLVRGISLVYWGAGEAIISFRQPDQSPTVCLFIETWSFYVTLVVLNLDTLTRLSLEPTENQLATACAYTTKPGSLYSLKTCPVLGSVIGRRFQAVYWYVRVLSPCGSEPCGRYVVSEAMGFLEFTVILRW